MEIDDNAVLRVEEIGQHFVRQLRGQDVQEAHGPILAAQPEHPGVAEAERGRGNEILGGEARRGQPLPVKTERLAVRVENAVHDFQPFFRVQHPCHGPHRAEVPQQVGFDPAQPCAGHFQVVGLDGERQELALLQAVVAFHKLVLQDAGVLGPDVVEVVPLRLDLKALGVLLGVDLPVDKGKLDVDGSVQIVVKVAQVFKDGGFRVRLCKLVADVHKLNALGKCVGRHPAHAVLIHGLIGDAFLRRMGPAVALILSDDGLNFFLFGAGELYRCLCLRLVSLRFGQWHLPPFPFDAAGSGQNKRCWSGRDAPWALESCTG